MVARLPKERSDVGNWGQILNDFLCIEHNTDGTLRLADTILGKYDKPPAGIPISHLAASVQSSLAKADNSKTRLIDLNDVAITPMPAAGQAIIFDDTTGTWTNGTPDLPLLTKADIPVITKNDVGLGNVTNEAQLPLTGGALTGRLQVNNAVDQVNGLDVASSLGITRALADANGPTISMYKRGTTGDATAAVKSGNTIFALQAFGYYGTGYSQQGTLAINATQDWTSGARGSSMSFMVTPNGSTVRNIALTIGQNSQLTINGDISLANAKNIIFNTTTGSMIGTTGTQKLGFYGALPVIRPTGVPVTAAGIHAALVSLGLITA
jgi:hypothetical protein